jgi:NitT/TauT family transport system substrate-binding protein
MKAFHSRLAAALALSCCLAGAARADAPQPVRILMNWFAQADQGGYWDTQVEHLGADQGLAITAIQGGPKIQTIPQVAAGQAEFGMGNADDILLARLRGAPVKAVFVALDYVPYALLYHPPAVKTVTDLKDHIFAVNIGFAYWEWIKKRYAMGHVREIPVSGDLTMFRSTPDMVQQGYSIFLPYRMDDAGIPHAQFIVADLGYKPYDLMFTTDDMIANHHDLVVKVVAAVKQGWANFITDPTKVRPIMFELNKQIPASVHDKAVADMIATLLPTDPAKLGCMTDARWQELTKQLQDVNFLPADFDPKQAYDKTLVAGCPK